MIICWDNIENLRYNKKKDTFHSVYIKPEHQAWIDQQHDVIDIRQKNGLYKDNPELLDRDIAILTNRVTYATVFNGKHPETEQKFWDEIVCGDENTSKYGCILN